MKHKTWFICFLTPLLYGILGWLSRRQDSISLEKKLQQWRRTARRLQEAQRQWSQQRWWRQRSCVCLWRLMECAWVTNSSLTLQLLLGIVSLSILVFICVKRYSRSRTELGKPVWIVMRISRTLISVYIASLFAFYLTLTYINLISAVLAKVLTSSFMF